MIPFAPHFVFGSRFINEYLNFFTTRITRIKNGAKLYMCMGNVKMVYAVELREDDINWVDFFLIFLSVMHNEIKLILVKQITRFPSPPILEI